MSATCRGTTEYTCSSNPEKATRRATRERCNEMGSTPAFHTALRSTMGCPALPITRMARVTATQGSWQGCSTRACQRSHQHSHHRCSPRRSPRYSPRRSPRRKRPRSHPHSLFPSPRTPTQRMMPVAATSVVTQSWHEERASIVAVASRARVFPCAPRSGPRARARFLRAPVVLYRTRKLLCQADPALPRWSELRLADHRARQGHPTARPGRPAAGAFRGQPRAWHGGIAI